MEEEFKAFLLAGPDVADLVGGRGAWKAGPQGEPYPKFRLHLIGDPQGYDLDGGADPRGIRVQIDCDDTSWVGAKALSDALRARIRQLPDDAYPALHKAYLLDARDDDEAGEGPAADGSEDIYHFILDVRVHERT